MEESLNRSFRDAGLALIAAGCLVVGTGGISPGQAQTGIGNPMMAPNPMMPAPGRSLNPMVNPMQPPAARSDDAVERDPELGNLPVSEGVEDTFYACTACHSVQTFAQMRLTDERWDYLWGWMIKEQGMPDYGEEMREIILPYLKRHFSSQR
jgi:hypothetical protein